MLINPYIYASGQSNVITLLYTGDETERSLVFGQDMTDSLVIGKNRNITSDWQWYDSTRGAGNVLKSNNTDAQSSVSQGLLSFDSSGVTIGTDTSINATGNDFVLYGIPVKNGVFDKASYTGNGTTQNIAHGLGVTPAVIIVKNLDTGNWQVYHSGLNGGTNPEQYYIYLNNTTAQDRNSGSWNDTAPTSSQFTVGNSTETNQSGSTFIAYLFADNSANGIVCGTFEITDGNQISVTDVGFEGKWIIYKNVDLASDWGIVDAERGDGATGALLAPNTSGSENKPTSRIEFTSTGFDTDNLNNGKYIYVLAR